ncbi:MAG: hypothetical protein AAFV33_18120, partial [Chloroflexota bacterium]
MNVKKNLKVIGYFFFSWGILIAVLYMMTMISIYLNDLTWQFRLLDAVLLCVSAACGLGMPLCRQEPLALSCRSAR